VLAYKLGRMAGSVSNQRL